MKEPEIGDLTRRQLLAVSDKVLQPAGDVGILPTPIDTVTEAAGIAEVVDIADIPEDLLAKKPAAWKRVLGAFLYREQVIFVDRNQAVPRVRFTQFHEVGHRIVPWHRRSYELYDEEGLFGDTKERLDAEANLTAAHLIFQGGRFHEQALEYRRSITVPIALAPDHGASLHATIRYYAEHHPDPVAVVIAGRYSSGDGSLPIWRCIESPQFRRRFGRLDARFPLGRLLPASHPSQLLDGLAHEALKVDAIGSTEVRLRDLAGEDRRFTAEAFFNGHCVFVMLSPKQAVSLGRRLRVEAG